MNRDNCDIVVSGAGPAGLCAALAFASAGFSVALIDPVAPVVTEDAVNADLRSTAFLETSRSLFERIGVWKDLEPHSVPLERLRIVDTTGTPPTPRDERVFHNEADDAPLAWNFMNWQLRAVLLEAVGADSRIRTYFGRKVERLHRRTTSALVGLDNGDQIKCLLVVAADGRSSPLREMAGIRAKTTRYGQKSLAFVALHERPHDNISTEIYHEGGPFTMVPLHDRDGQPASAIVWMNKSERSTTLRDMEVAQFDAEMTARSAGLFGKMSLVGRRGIFPIITQVARTVISERLALVAEAAHVLPPIGAQGLNTSLNDIATLLIALPEGGDPGHENVLQAYETGRRRDLAIRSTAIDLFNRVTRSGLPPLQSLRLAGLKAAHDFAPLKKTLIRGGMRPL